MYTLYVNGAVCRTEKNSKLLDYLRDDLRLTSVKNGCGEGACGTCTVLVDGKKAKACVFRVAKLDGKHITSNNSAVHARTGQRPLPNRSEERRPRTVFWSEHPFFRHFPS